MNLLGLMTNGGDNILNHPKIYALCKWWQSDHKQLEEFLYSDPKARMTFFRVMTNSCILSVLREWVQYNRLVKRYFSAISLFDV